MRRRLLLITLAVVCLILGINLITRGEYLSGKVEAYLLAKAREELGYNVGMERLIFNFFPSYLDLEKPYVKGWDLDDPERSISAQRVRVYFSLPALLNKELSIRRVQLYSPSIELERLKGGGYNTDPLTARVRGLLERKGAAGGFKVEVREVAVFDARLHYKDPASGVSVFTDNAGLDFRLKGKDNFWVGYRVGELVAKRSDLPPFHIALSGDMLWKDGEAKVEALRLSAERTMVKAAGSVVWSRRPALDLKLDARLDLDLLDRLSLWKSGPSGEADIKGVVKGTYPGLAGDGTLALVGVRYAGLEIKDAVSKIAFEKGALTVPSIKSSLLGGAVEGDLAVDFGGEAVTFRSSWTLRDLISGYYTEKKGGLAFIPWQKVSGTVAVSGRGLNLKDIAASGRLDLSKYEKPHTAPGVSRELDIIKAAHLDFMLRDGRIQVAKGAASSKASVVNFTGSVGLDGESDLVIKGHSEDVGEVSTLIGYSDVHGKLDLTAYMRGNIKEPVIDGKAQITAAAAHGIPFRSGYGDVGLSGWVLSFKDFSIDQGNGNFLLNGRIAFKGEGASFLEPRFVAKLGVRDADVRKIISIFYRDIPVNLVAGGELSFEGDRRKFKGEGRLATSAGDVYGQEVDKGEVSAVLSEKDIAFPKIVAVKGRDIVTASGGIGFNGTFYAKASSARVDLANFNLLMGTGLPVKGSVSATITGGGSFKHPDIKANLQAYRLYYKDVDLGAGSVAARITNGVMTVNGSVLDEKVLVDGFMGLGSPYVWRARLTFNEGRFEPFVRLLYKKLPEDVSLISTGVFTGEGALKDPSRAAFSVSFSKVSAEIMGRRLKNDGEVSLAYKSGRLAVKSLKLQGEGVNLEAEGGAEGLEELDLSIKAQADLAVMKKFVEESVDYIDGSGRADIHIRGGLKNPVLSGRVKVQDAGLKFKDFSQRFDKINAEAVFDEGGFTLTGLSAELGGGAVSASGKGSLKGFAVDNFSLGINAEGVKVKFPDNLVSTVDARLSFEGAESQRSISGEAVIKKARYSERVDWKSWLMEFQKERTEISTRDIGPLGDITLNIHITGSDSIKIDNNVAKIPVSSDLYVRGTINNPVLLGRLESTGGLVYLRNNEFKLLNGVAEFADPHRLNPIIDLQAETKVKEYMIRLSLSGTVDKLNVTLLSDPPLEDVDIITLLALGRTSEQLKGHESALASGEGASFVTGQIQDAVESRLRRITGFDRFQIDPYLTSKGTTTSPRVTVGKSLMSDKLYITYSSNVGTSEEQFVRMEYIFSKNLSLVGERDELGRFGGDLKFRLEFK